MGAEATQRFKAMGCPCELRLCGTSQQLVDSTIAAAIAEVERIEAKYSRYRASSFLSQINSIATHGGSLDVDPETASLLDYANTCYAQSEGLFDITSGVLRAAWRFDAQVLPDPLLIQELRQRIGWQHVDWHPPKLAFELQGMEIDFGGIAKEYAVDRLATLCRDAGITSGIVNLGGDVRVLGARPDGQPWRVALAHPRTHQAALKSLVLTDGAVATSGDYERCIVIDGARYGHLLNPRTGWPVRHLAAVSVVADLCVVAGSASTIAMLMEERGPAWLAQLGLPHLWVDVAGRVGGSLAN